MNGPTEPAQTRSRPATIGLRPPAFAIYLLVPVPLAVLGLLGLATLESGGLRPKELGPFLGFGILWGYVFMGLQSLLFAALMHWLDRRATAAAARYLVAGMLGCLCGASIVLGNGPILLPAIGAVVGPLTVALADLVRPAR